MVDDPQPTMAIPDFVVQPSQSSHSKSQDASEIKEVRAGFILQFHHHLKFS